MGQSQTTIKSSAFLQIPQLGQAAPLVLYITLTAEIRMTVLFNINTQDSCDREGANVLVYHQYQRYLDISDNLNYF